MVFIASKCFIHCIVWWVPSHEYKLLLVLTRINQNIIRQAVHSDYYEPPHQSHIGKLPGGGICRNRRWRNRLEHCLEAIRQTIQCYGSTTLIPTMFREGLNEGYIDSNQIHTCRSFTALREFVDSRRVNESAFVYRDQSLLDKTKHALAVEHGIYIEPKRPKVVWKDMKQLCKYVWAVINIGFCKIYYYLVFYGCNVYTNFISLMPVLLFSSSDRS